jgi:hypothetical protein
MSDLFNSEQLNADTDYLSYLLEHPELAKLYNIDLN